MGYFCDRCGFVVDAPGSCPLDLRPLRAPVFGSLLGERIGNYVVVEELGAGMAGTVYRGIHPEIGRQVAIKVLSATCARDATAHERLLREAQATNRIASERVPKVTDAGILADRRPYLVMDLVGGETLGQQLERVPQPPPRELLGLVDQLLEAVAAAHRASIVHRDLKPDNIKVTPSGLLVVLDFGIAKLLDVSAGATLTRTGDKLGTPAYMAPEQIATGIVDERTDVYAAALIMYEMLAGRRPFVGTEFEVFSAHVSTPPPPLQLFAPSVPAVVESIVRTGLAKDPSQRFQNASALRNALGHVKPWT